MPSRKFTCALTLIAALYLVSCSPTKSLCRQTVDASVQHNATTDRADSTVREKTAKIDAEQHSDEEVVTVVEVFDTTQPTSAATGTPPLKSRSTQSRRKIEQSAQSITATDTEQKAVTEHSKQQTQTASQTATETQTARGLNWWQRLLCYTGFFVIVGAVAWLAWRIAKPHF